MTNWLDSKGISRSAESKSFAFTLTTCSSGKEEPLLCFLRREPLVASRGLLGGREKIRSRVFTIEGLQPSWLGGRAKCVAYGIVVILTIGLITGFVVGLSTGLIAAPIVGMGDSLVIALIFGTLFGLIAGAMEATGGIAYPGGLSFDLFGGLGAVPLLRIAAVETLS